MEGWTIKDILDIGLSAVLLFLLINERTDRKAMTERIFGYLEAAREQRHKMAQDLTTARLRAERSDKDNPPPK
jgi:hypothetical protein